MTSHVPAARNRLHEPALAGLLLGTFLVLCWRYASGLNLWGDEAYSLDFVEGRTAVVDPSHLPTYYVLLKLLTSIVPGVNEPALRMLHASVFALGLCFGALAVRRMTGSGRIALIALGVAILLPDFLFYATNLRMYSLVFAAVMANVDAVSRLADRHEKPTSAALAWYAVSGAALVAVDFPGLFYYVIGAVYLAVAWLRARRWALLPTLLLPLLPLLGYVLANASLFADLLRWRPEGDRSTSSMSFDFLTAGYLSVRPGLDLVYSAALPKAIALALPPVVFAVILVAASRQAIAARATWSAERLIPPLALGWLLLVPTGFTFTRIFLPSQFFMIVVRVQAMGSRERPALRGAATAATAVLVLVNLYQALAPTYRLDAAVPYRQIANDATALCAVEGIATVVASDNSLNVESIFRYMRDNPAGRGLRLLTVNEAELDRRSTDLRGSPFLFISHMGGAAPLVDVHRFAQRTPQRVRGYVALHELPYNDLWKRRYTEHAGQADAIEIWVVR